MNKLKSILIEETIYQDHISYQLIFDSLSPTLEREFNARSIHPFGIEISGTTSPASFEKLVARLAPHITWESHTTKQLYMNLLNLSHERKDNRSPDATRQFSSRSVWSLHL